MLDDDAALAQRRAMAKLMIRVDFGNGSAIGPGKVRLLELIAETGSIRKAAAGMRMSYRRAWLLLQALEATFEAPLVLTATGGRAGGGARLTALGGLVAACYRAIEIDAAKATARHMALLAKRAGKPGAIRRRAAKPLK